jgi:hypothetical protein
VNHGQGTITNNHPTKETTDTEKPQRRQLIKRPTKNKGKGIRELRKRGNGENLENQGKGTLNLFVASHLNYFKT